MSKLTEDRVRQIVREEIAAYEADILEERRIYNARIVEALRKADVRDDGIIATARRAWAGKL